MTTTRAALPLVAVIDDDDDFCILMNDVLTLEGYDIVVAHHPTEAFALLKDTSPDLLILDLAFDRTRIAGLALLRTLRAAHQTRTLPVIIASAATDLLITHEAEFTELNAVTLAKPFDLSDFISLVATRIARGTTENRERTSP